MGIRVVSLPRRIILIKSTRVEKKEKGIVSTETILKTKKNYIIQKYFESNKKKTRVSPS